MGRRGAGRGLRSKRCAVARSSPSPAIARPERFFAMLRAHGLAIVERPLEDHADFAALPWPADAADVVVTEKDAVKLPPSRRLNARVWVARLDFVPGPAFDAALLALLPPPSAIDAHGNTPS